jgi:prepilin-type N-terminal cleavage/methylation domain-containing protein
MRIKAARAFTLIEILVVIVIIGISCHFAVLAFGDFGLRRAARVSLQDFERYIILIRYQAVVESQTLGIEIMPQRYATKIFKHDKWQNLRKNSNIYHKNFPQRLTAKLSKPQDNIIAIDATGDIDAFTLEFSLDKKAFARMSLDDKQQIVIEFYKDDKHA